MFAAIKPTTPCLLGDCPVSAKSGHFDRDTFRNHSFVCLLGFRTHEHTNLDYNDNRSSRMFVQGDDLMRLDNEVGLRQRPRAQVGNPNSAMVRSRRTLVVCVEGTRRSSRPFLDPSSGCGCIRLALKKRKTATRLTISSDLLVTRDRIIVTSSVLLPLSQQFNRRLWATKNPSALTERLFVEIVPLEKHPTDQRYERGQAGIECYPNRPERFALGIAVFKSHQ